MGNSFSTSPNKESTHENFYEIIDYIATYYILTMDFKSLSKLSEKEYCDNLVVLTSDIIKKYFTDLEVTYLAQRVKNGLEVNELSKENIIFLNKDQLENMDIQNDAQKSIKKKRVCIGIAKFYVKIAHVFAAILTTINPVYVYKDENGNTVKKGLLEKDQIPKNVNRKIYKLNICDNRIKSLKKEDKNEDNNEGINDTNNEEKKEDVNSKSSILHPKICDMNLTKDGSIKSLADEPGITELMQLYLDDKYDYSNGTFGGMSDSTKKQFQKDLKTFYTAFTGNDVMPPEIQKFSDIKLKNYNIKPGCQGENASFKKPYSVSKNDDLFISYAKNIKNMIESAASKQNELLLVINEIFTFVIDPYTKKKKIRINPKLNDELLQKMVEKTRAIIIELYVKCENDYVNGLKIYETIVEKKILETTQKQIQTLQKEANNIISETNQITKPIKENLIRKPDEFVVNKTEINPNSQIITEKTNEPVIIQNNNLNPVTISSEKFDPMIQQPNNETSFRQPNLQAAGKKINIKNKYKK